MLACSPARTASCTFARPAWRQVGGVGRQQASAPLSRRANSQAAARAAALRVGRATEGIGLAELARLPLPPPPLPLPLPPLVLWPPASRMWCAAAAWCLVLCLAGGAAGEDGGTSLPFVPDGPGADAARSWLAQHRRVAAAAEPGGPSWPPALSLPACDAPPGPPPVQLRPPRQADQAAQAPQAEQPAAQRRERLLIAATVGDSWGPDASRNRCAPALLCRPPGEPACLLESVGVEALLGGLPDGCCSTATARKPARCPRLPCRSPPDWAALVQPCPNVSDDSAYLMIHRLACCSAAHAMTDRFAPPPACRWLDDPHAAAGFDLVVVYYGTNASFACPQCLHVSHDRGTKCAGRGAGESQAGEWGGRRSAACGRCGVTGVARRSGRPALTPAPRRAGGSYCTG